MLNCIENGVKNWENEGEVADFLTKILNKEENDHSGLIYGMGHAVYTLSDPRAVQLKKSALKLAKGTEVEAVQTSRYYRASYSPAFCKEQG